MDGFDMEIIPVENFVSFVEVLEKTELPFVISHKTTGKEIGQTAVRKELSSLLPLIGCGGDSTIPFISDPEKKIPGVFGIVDEKLIYSRTGIALQSMRDSYTWGYSTVDYFTEKSCKEIILAFVENGYHIYTSDNLKNYRKDTKFTFTGPVDIDSILL